MVNTYTLTASDIKELITHLLGEPKRCDTCNDVVIDCEKKYKDPVELELGIERYLMINYDKNEEGEPL